ncbi:MAG: LysR family transcriptional regulator [Albidovulum sp.]
MDLSLRAMRYTRMAMRKGSIAAAAEELNVATSAVSAALNQAEAAFGLTLVTRARAKGISTTSAGRAILQRIEDFLDRYEALLANGAEMRSSLSGLLKVGYYAPIAPAFLPRILHPLVAANPELTLSLEECDNVQAQAGLLAGSYDVILFVADLPLPQIEVTRLVQAPSYCLCRADHPFAGRASVSLREVAAQTLIILDRPVATAYYRELLEREGQKLKVAATANSTEMVRSLVGTGLGCSILNMRPSIKHSYAGDAIVTVPIEDVASGLTLSLGVTAGPVRRIIQVFSEACLTYFATDAGQDLVVTQ